MPYARHTMTTIDASNYDAMIAISDGDDFGDFSQWPGLRLIRVVRVAEDRFLTTGGYIDKASADANVDDPPVPGVAQFEKNISVREGEVIWSYYR